MCHLFSRHSKWWGGGKELLFLNTNYFDILNYHITSKMQLLKYNAYNLRLNLHLNTVHWSVIASVYQCLSSVASPSMKGLGQPLLHIQAFPEWSDHHREPLIPGYFFPYQVLLEIRHNPPKGKLRKLLNRSKVFVKDCSWIMQVIN